MTPYKKCPIIKALCDTLNMYTAAQASNGLPICPARKPHVEENVCRVRAVEAKSAWGVWYNPLICVTWLLGTWHGAMTYVRDTTAAYVAWLMCACSEFVQSKFNARKVQRSHDSPLIWMSHVSHMNEARLSYAWVMSLTYCMWHDSHTYILSSCSSNAKRLKCEGSLSLLSCE